MERYFWYDDSLEKIPEGMMSVCVYADDSGLYTEEECDECNISYLLFPKSIVVDWFLDGTNGNDVKLHDDFCDFREFMEKYTADDTIGLCRFAHLMGFDPVRYSETEA